MKAFFFFRAEDGIRDLYVTGVQTCALPIWGRRLSPYRVFWDASRMTILWFLVWFVANLFGDNAPITFEDRKSTRLNSSHVEISYAVFCLKKKKKNKI